MLATGDTLSDAVRALAADKDGRSGIYALTLAHEAFAARVALARAAQRTLDIQYYIWRDDTTGWLLLEELWDAAERGVRVRLLLDDNGIPGLDPALATLNGHDNIDVRLFNPFPYRRFKALGYLTDFRRLNRRMHNKSFTADAAVTIVGGRNVGDEYFGAGRIMEFADLDVLAIGRVAGEVTAAFDEYWNDDSVVRLESVVRPAVACGAPALLGKCAAVRRSAEALAYVDAVRSTRIVEALLARDVPLEWSRVRLVCDPPTKIKQPAPDTSRVFEGIRQALGKPNRSIDLISPYFVPGKKGTAALAEFAEHGIALRVLTNSLAATDVAAVHAGYARSRAPLLHNGAKIYELKPDGVVPGRKRGARMLRGSGSSTVSLHAKTFAVDRAHLFVGSLNLDPRSIRLNTEMGLVIESERLAETVARLFDETVAHTTYEVVLMSNGGLEWIERTENGEVRYRAEPKTGLLRRFAVWVMALLPIEWLL